MPSVLFCCGMNLFFFLSHDFKHVRVCMKVCVCVSVFFSSFFNQLVTYLDVFYVL